MTGAGVPLKNTWVPARLVPIQTRRIQEAELRKLVSPTGLARTIKHYDFTGCHRTRQIGGAVGNRADRRRLDQELIWLEQADGVVDSVHHINVAGSVDRQVGNI